MLSLHPRRPDLPSDSPLEVSHCSGKRQCVCGREGGGEGGYAPPGTLGKVWRYIWLLQLGRAVNGLWSAEARSAAKLHAMLRTAPHSPGQSGPECP